MSDAATVDVVIPAYDETAEAVEKTVEALLAQTLPPSRVIVVDDHSQEPIQWRGRPDPRVTVLRVPQNGGISAARNAGMRSSDAAFLACINMEVIVDPTWVEVGVAYMRAHPNVGAVAGRTDPRSLSTALGHWRSLVQERPFPDRDGPVDWLPGHAVLFRRSAMSEVNGFDVELKKAREDVDICRRLRQRGWDVHYVAGMSAHSIQTDSLATFARAEYNRFVWRAPAGNGFLRAMAILTGRGLMRSVLHVIRGRWRLLPVEAGVWAHSARLAWQKR